MSGQPDPKPIRAEKAPRKGLRARRKPSRSADEQQASLAFKTRVLALDGHCVSHAGIGCVGVLQAHHVVTQQQLRAAGRDDLLWDPSNGVTVCEGAHERHTKALERLNLATIPRRCLNFAERYGFEDILRRYYPAA